MTTVLIVLIAIGVLGIAALVFLRAKQSRREAARQRERVTRRVEGHQEEATRHTSRASNLEPQAEEHRRRAEEHVAKATELEEQATRSREYADAHEERAAQAKRELDS